MIQSTHDRKASYKLKIRLGDHDGGGGGGGGQLIK